MARKKTLTSKSIEEKKFDLMQKIIDCDNWIYRTIGSPEAQQIWVQRKNDFEFELEQLEIENEINLI